MVQEIDRTPRVQDVAADLRTHEAVCAERYNNLVSTMGGIQKSLFWAFTLYVGTMASAIAAIALRLAMRS